MVVRRLLILTGWILLGHQRWAVCSSADGEDTVVPEGGYLNQDGNVRPVPKLGTSCVSHDDCRNLNSECRDSKCSCTSSYPVEVDNKYCREAVPVNGTCISNFQCSYNGTAALCQAGLCVCRLGYKTYKVNESLTCVATKGPPHSLRNSPCGDWMPYKNEKCIKLVKEASLQTKVESEIVCQTFAEKLYIDDIPKLVTVETQEKQLFLENLLFEEMTALDNVWLGLDLGEDDQFRWNNRTDLFFSNWVDESRTDKEHRCVQMKSGEAINERGKWLKVNCNKKGAIVCERTQPWSIIELQNVLLSLKLEVIKNNQAWKQKLNDAKKEAEEANLKIAEANQEIARIKQNPVPVGFIYIQLPGQAPPTTLWPQTSWKDVGSNYSGLFFRAEGGDAAPFGQLQEDNTRSLARVYFFSGFNDLDNDPLIPSDGSWSTYVKSGLDGSGSLIGLRFRLNSGEVRPRNKSVKIWQRIN